MLATTPRYHTETLPNGLCFEMVKVEGGAFMMGSERGDDEQPIHQVTVPDFLIGKFPVTQELWKAVMGENPSFFKGKTNPVENVSWDDTQIFLQKLNQVTDQNYRLPSESEWEYAARGGKYGRGFLYSGSHKLKEVGWYTVNSHQETKPVGLKKCNELGLFDMSGNVEEWCADHWHEDYDGAPEDGSVWVEGGDSNHRVVRGGSWDLDAFNCSVSYRFWNYSVNRYLNIGFRLARY